ncbi:MAG TPA: fumarylacetoacetate hydrolase family protein [Clostridia bacterium]|nr:fumarylacetoacetate hydrolase family protein [Clostridia bacterium]
MRFCRYMTPEGARYGIISTVDGRDTITASMPGPQLQVSEFGIPQRIMLPAVESIQALETAIPLDKATVLIPFPLLSKVLCVGRNYADHVHEMGNDLPKSPLIFSKPPSSLLSNGGEIRRPAALSQRVDHEGELGVIIGRTCHKLGDDEDVRDYVLGYTCVNDVTARDLQKTDGQWTRAKGFDTFCPVGPAISTDIDPWKGVKVETRVNGEVRQSGSTADFIFPLDAIIRYISQVMTLLPGDLIATGTPSGVGPLNPGDVVEITVEGVGTLRNPVVND